MNTSSEHWKPVPGWEGYYEVSNHGRVAGVGRRDSRGHLRKRRILSLNRRTPSGHLRAALSRDGKTYTRLIHQLVAEAFIGPRPEGLEVCHNNGDPSDNRPENLRYDTRTANMRDAVKHRQNHNSAKTHCKHGHEFAGDNLYVNPNRPTARFCRQCARDFDRKYRQQRRKARA